MWGTEPYLGLLGCPALLAGQPSRLLLLGLVHILGMFYVNALLQDA